MSLRERVRRTVRGGRFAHGLITVSSGSAAVQVLGIAAAPLTARIFRPSEMGLAGVINSIVAVCAGVACLRYEQAISLPEGRGGRLSVLGVCLVVMPVVAAIGAVVVGLGSDVIVALLREPRVRPFLPLIPVGIAATALFNVLTQWFIREQDFKGIVRTRFQQSAGQIGFQLAVGSLTGGRAWVLVSGYILGFVLGIRGLLARDRRLPADVRAAVTWPDVRDAARVYRKFPFYNSWASLFDTLAPTLPLLAVASLFGAEQAGFVRMAQTLVLLPIGALATGIASVYWSESARLVHEDPHELRRLYVKITRRLVGVGVLLIAGSTLLPLIVPVVFTPTWTPSAYYAIIVAFPAAGGLVCSAAINLSLLSFNHWESLWIVGRLAVLVAAVAAAKLLGFSPRALLMVLAGVLVLGYAVLVWLNLVAIRRRVAAHGEANGGLSGGSVKRQQGGGQARGEAGTGSAPVLPSWFRDE